MTTSVLCIVLRKRQTEAKLSHLTKIFSPTFNYEKSISKLLCLIKSVENVENALVTWTARCTFIAFVLISFVYVNTKSFVIFIDLYREQFMKYLSILWRFLLRFLLHYPVQRAFFKWDMKIIFKLPWNIVSVRYFWLKSRHASLLMLILLKILFYLLSHSPWLLNHLLNYRF